MNENFKGVWIPANLFLSKGLTWTQKLMLVEINSFNKNGLQCFVSNNHLSDHLQISKSGVEKALKGLVEKGMVKRQFEYQINTGATLRILRLPHPLECDPPTPSSDTPPITRVRHTNTITKTKTNTINKGRPTSEGDCLEYFKELELDSNEASKFYDWYEQTGWKLKGGNLIKDWKATARNWKRRTKIQNNEKRTKGFNKGNFDANTLERFVTEG